jgi:hypothetical protein
MGQLTDRAAAGLLLCTLLNNEASAEIRSLIVTGLEPRDMFQVEYMMILASAQHLHNAGEPIELETLESELAPKDPAAFARIVLRSIHEERHNGPTRSEDVNELLGFLISFRDRS